MHSAVYVFLITGNSYASRVPPVRVKIVVGAANCHRWLANSPGNGQTAILASQTSCLGHFHAYQTINAIKTDSKIAWKV
jgi:hypothetical protein